MAKILTRCPVCDGALGVSELRCGRCKTTIHGAFDPCRFCRLAAEHLGFIEMFLRCEGNLSRVEKELNLSYPTVRNRLQAALAALELAGDTPPRHDVSVDELLGMEERSATPAYDAGERRRAVLEALARGDMSAEDAAESLRDLS